MELGCCRGNLVRSSPLNSSEILRCSVKSGVVMGSLANALAAIFKLVLNDDDVS